MYLLSTTHGKQDLAKNSINSRRNIEVMRNSIQCLFRLVQFPLKNDIFILKRELTVSKNITVPTNTNVLNVDITDKRCNCNLITSSQFVFSLAAFMPGPSNMHPAKGFRLYSKAYNYKKVVP